VVGHSRILRLIDDNSVVVMIDDDDCYATIMIDLLELLARWLNIRLLIDFLFYYVLITVHFCFCISFRHRRRLLL